jgi:Activator of Hsp90 ATPase homolog 1-like protein
VDDLATVNARVAPPITHEYQLRCAPGEAFRAYTERIGEWWDPRYTANADTLVGVTIEPRVGGRVYATHSDFGEIEWGEVTAWEPARRLVHSFHLAQDPAHPSEVSVEFTRSGDGCVVRFAHGGWNEANASERRKFSDWSVILERYVRLVDDS